MPSPRETIYELYAGADFKTALETYRTFEAGLDEPDERLLATVGQCCFKCGETEQAAGFFLRAAEAGNPPKLQFYSLAFELFRRAGNSWKALQAAEFILRLSPKHAAAAQFRRHHLFDFLQLDELEAGHRAALPAIQSGDEFALACELPHRHIMWCGDERINALVSDRRSPLFSMLDSQTRRTRPHRFGDKIRIGYLSGDVSSAHATMILMRGIIDQHDRERFDITLYCNTPDDLIARDDGFRKQAGRIVDIKALSDAEAADRIRNDEIDILVDLKGHTKDARIGVVNAGAAPIQVAWLGFPGSGIGIDCDYVIGDAIVTPDSSKLFYHEKFCRLPECYQPNDNRHRPLPPPARRSDLGLPDDRMVFASFNSVRKISPETASAWVRILEAAPESVLWMMCQNDVARANFTDWMKRHGVAEDRIIFSRAIGMEGHAARIQAADLCLDTFPCNGHTTTSDCLWSGLPVLTVKGSNFASRVSESLLRAIELPELVAEDIDEYVALAVKLAQERTLLDDLRQRLAANRFTAPLFDTERFTRHLERAYEMMAARAKVGLPPDHIDVPAMPRRMESRQPRTAA